MTKTEELVRELLEKVGGGVLETEEEIAAFTAIDPEYAEEESDDELDFDEEEGEWEVEAFQAEDDEEGDQ